MASVQSVVNSSLNFVGNTLVRPHLPGCTNQYGVAGRGGTPLSDFLLILSLLSLALFSVLHFCSFACLIDILGFLN